MEDFCGQDQGSNVASLFLRHACRDKVTHGFTYRQPFEPEGRRAITHAVMMEVMNHGHQRHL